MSKMKVLEVISSLGPTGGGETFAVNLSRELSELVDLKVVILFKNYKQFFIERLLEKGIQPIILNKKKHFDLKNAKELRKIINEFKPDVIHTENNALIPTYLALRKTAYKKSINVFHTMHLMPKDECSNTLVRILYKHILKKKNYIPVAITKNLSIVSSKFYSRENVPFVNNGVDLAPFKNEKKLKDRKYDIVVVGRFSLEKNHVFLIKAFARLKEIIPNISIALVGSGELFDQVKQMAVDLGVSENTLFTGVLNSPAEIVNDSKIIVLGSLFEANPLSLLEGMHSGCVVVSTDVGGVADIIHEPENGFLFNVNDEDAFIQIITKILGDIDGYEPVREHNSQYSNNFSMKKCAKDYYDLFVGFDR